jgi:DNA-directed RNA polymerase subunit alpha
MKHDIRTVEELDLTIRTYNLLRLADIATAQQLRQMKDADILKLPHCGKRGLVEIRKALDRRRRQRFQLSIDN